MGSRVLTALFSALPGDYRCDTPVSCKMGLGCLKMTKLDAIDVSEPYSLREHANLI